MTVIHCLNYKEIFDVDRKVEEKSFLFAIRIVKLYKYLTDTKREYHLSKQLLRSGTSIGANIAEAQQAQSQADFISKLSFSLKEASETDYWLRLLNATVFLSDAEFLSIHGDCTELEKLLTAIIKTAKQRWKITVNCQLSTVNSFYFRR